MPSWVRTFELDELESGRGRVFKTDGRQVAIVRIDETTVHAVDNLCPHEGYPLAEGYVQGCVLTCAWHNYKFDLRDGACVMGEEAVRAYPVRVKAGVVHVDMAEPDPSTAMPGLWSSLDVGLTDYRMGRVARDAVRLLEAGVPAAELVAHAVGWDAVHAEFGSTHALAVGADALRYLTRRPGPEAAYPVVQVLDIAAESSVRRSPRPVPDAVDPGADAVAAGHRLAELVESEEADAAQAHVRGAIARGFARAELEGWFLQLNRDHFLNFGHQLIYTTKVFDLLDAVGWQHADPVLPALTFAIVTGTREDTLPAMRGLGARLAEVAPRFRQLDGGRGDVPEPDRLQAAVAFGRGEEAFAAVLAALEAGAAPERVLDAIALAAAERMLTFDVAIDRDPGVQDGWLWVTHPFTYADAVRRALQRDSRPERLRFLFFAMHFVNRTRPLEGATEPIVEVTAAAVDDVVAALRERRPALAIACVARYLDDGGDIEALRIALEDLALMAPIARPIIQAHATKTTIAAFDTIEALSGADRRVVARALVRFLATPVVERSLTRLTQEAIGFVVGGRPPRVLAG